jgi:hypothetical protein
MQIPASCSQLPSILGKGPASTLSKSRLRLPWLDLIVLGLLPSLSLHRLWPARRPPRWRGEPCLPSTFLLLSGRS